MGQSPGRPSSPGKGGLRVEARFEKDHFVCGFCGGDLPGFKISPDAHKISLSGVALKGPCGHPNVIRIFEKA